VAYTPEMLAMLEAQRAHFASDDHIRREVAVWADATPAERLAEVAEMCEMGAHFASYRGSVTERALWPEDTLELLARLRRAR